MKTKWRWQVAASWCGCISLLFAGRMGDAGAAGQAPLRFIAPTNHAMPVAQFERGQLVGGLLRSVGDALAEELGRDAEYISLPAKRAPQSLAAGDADLMCYALPEWLAPRFRWSLPFMPNALVLVARQEAPSLASPAALAGRRIGTVLGYRYRDLERQLGGGFVREDAIDMQANLRKLGAGRVDYALTERLAFRSFLQRHPEVRLEERFELLSYAASCAVSMHSTLRIEELNGAIRRLERSGRLAGLLQPGALR